MGNVCAAIGPKEVIINDDNYKQFVDEESYDKDGNKRMKGLIPRDLEKFPKGCFKAARPFDLPLIPESEWENLLQMRINAKALLSDVRNRGMNGKPMPSRDQNGQGYCHTADTEVLTERGWTAWPDYNWKDLLGTMNPRNGNLEFQAPLQQHIYEYKGPIVHSTNRRIDFGVTPDHKLLVRKWDESQRTLADKFTYQKAGKLGWYLGLPHSTLGWRGTELVEIEIPGDRSYDGDDFLALMALVVSDGFAAKYKHSGNLVSFASFRPEVRERVAALATRCGFKEQPSRPGVWNRWGAEALCDWIFANCYAGGNKAPHKKVPDLVKVASARQIKHFLAWFDDQNRSPNADTTFYSTSKRMIDDLQELHLRIGKRGTIHGGGTNGKISITKKGAIICSKNPGYVLSIGSTDKLCLDKKKHIETDSYNGLVYCAGVPNHTLVTRRNGSVLVSGNCWAHSSTSAILILRALSSQPYSDLSAFSVACTIKNYRNEGGFGAESLEFIADRGIADSSVWPQKSKDRSLKDNPKVWENAKQHRFTEWLDCKGKNKAQFVTLLLMGIPVVSDFNWWSHSVCTLDLVSVNPFRTRIWNSWGDGWSENGTGILEGNKAIPDDFIAPDLETASLS